MITKTIIALSALLVVGTSSAALAYDDAENKIGDRYPFLEQRYQPTSAKADHIRVMPVPKAPKLDQYNNEDVESKIADRYPLLEQPIRFANVGPKGGRTTRHVMPFTFAEKKMFDHQSEWAVF